MQTNKFFNKQIAIISTIILSIFISACTEKTPEQIEADNQKQISVSVRRAKVLMYEDAPKDAIKLLEDTYLECGESAELLETLANAYVQNNNAKSAAKYFELASEQKGGDTQLLLTAAKAYQQSGEISSASKAYEKYLQLKPTDIFVWKTLSDNYITEKKYQQALNAYTNALNTIGKVPSIIDASKLGSLYVKLENYSESRKWLEAAYKASKPEHIDVKKGILLNLVRTYLAQKEAIMLTAAIKELDKIDATLIATKHTQLSNQIRDFYDNLKSEKLATEKKEKAALLAKQEAKSIEDLKDSESKKTEETKAEVAKTELPKDKKTEIDAQKAKDVVKTTQTTTVKEITKTADATETKEVVDTKQTTVNAESKEVIETKETVKTTETKEVVEPVKEEKATEIAKTTETKESEPAKEESKSEKIIDLTDAPALEAAIIQNDEAKIQEAQTKDLTNEPAQVSKYDTYVQKCYEAIDNGNAKLAEQLAHKAISENSAHEAAWRALGKAYEMSNKDTDSYLAATEAYKRNPDDINATLFFLRNASRVLNNEKFLNEIYQAYEKFPNNPEIWYGLAKTYKLLNNRNNALYFCNLFIKNTSADHPLYEEIQKDFKELSNK